MSKFSERLKELRKEKCLSQHQLAKIIGVSKSSINMYERGEREPGLETIEAIADFYNVDLDYLLGKTNIPNRTLLTSAETIISDTDYSLYNKLDKVDKAEIRGTIKQMLKADKYKTAADERPTNSISEEHTKTYTKKNHDYEIAAWGADGTKGKTYTSPTKEIT